ncbi:MAG TPA: winged helix-turn-helix domain-containing protein [Bdellovibrionota bacterium]|nr:winged helix-turn-helix domain-containing protein [Bdellovibrionota bacterium]
MRRDFEALEERRFLAAELIRKGVHEAEVARQVGVCRQSVNRWAQQLQARGKKGLQQAGRAGRKPKIAAKDLQRIEKQLKAGAEAQGYQTGLWTLPRVAQLIEAECGVSYHPGHVWRILKSLGWSVQRPTGRAIERDEEAIARWKKSRWPALKKKPGARNARSSSSTKVG